MRAFIAKLVAVLIFAATTAALVGAYNSTSATQYGYPGVAMENIEKNDKLIEIAKANKAPISLPPANQEGQLSAYAYKNVQVLGHITTGEMTRLMTAMALWVAPKQGCAYCHAPLRDAAGKPVLDSDGNLQADQNNLHSDEVYAKRVGRRMLQMTMHINQNWKTHVKETGVTCYTCHRGNPVPAYIWYDQVPSDPKFIGEKAGQNMPSYNAALASLPDDPFRPFLAGNEGIRIISTEPLPIDNRASIKQAEWSYALMMHISNALNVNCTYCHNTRSMAEWSVSPPARTTAYYGIRMVRDLNGSYLEGLSELLPPERLGPAGDVPKANCATCHQGAYKPLLGVSMLKDYMALAEAKPQPPKIEAIPDGGIPDGGFPDGGGPIPDGGVAPVVPGAAPAAVPGSVAPGAAPAAVPGSVAPAAAAPSAAPAAAVPSKAPAAAPASAAPGVTPKPGPEIPAGSTPGGPGPKAAPAPAPATPVAPAGSAPKTGTAPGPTQAPAGAPPTQATPSQVVPAKVPAPPGHTAPAQSPPTGAAPIQGGPALANPPKGGAK